MNLLLTAFEIVQNHRYTYGPHSPTAYSNGPSNVEPQCEWIVRAMKRMRESGHTRLNAQTQAENDWKAMINATHAMTLRDKVDSWYMGECQNPSAATPPQSQH